MEIWQLIATVLTTGTGVATIMAATGKILLDREKQKAESLRIELEQKQAIKLSEAAERRRDTEEIISRYQRIADDEHSRNQKIADEGRAELAALKGEIAALRQEHMVCIRDAQDLKTKLMIATADIDALHDKIRGLEAQLAAA